MTETSPVAVSNFIAGVIVAGFAIVVVVNISTSSVANTQENTDQSALQEMKNKINRVCEDRQDVAEGSLTLTADTKLILRDDKIFLTGVESEDKEVTVSCPIDSREEREGSVLYTIEEAGEGYGLR